MEIRDMAAKYKVGDRLDSTSASTLDWVVEILKVDSTTSKSEIIYDVAPNKDFLITRSVPESYLDNNYNQFYSQAMHPINSIVLPPKYKITDLLKFRPNGYDYEVTGFDISQTLSQDIIYYITLLSSSKTPPSQVHERDLDSYFTVLYTQPSRTSVLLQTTGTIQPIAASTTYQVGDILDIHGYGLAEIMVAKPANAAFDEEYKVQPLLPTGNNPSQMTVYTLNDLNNLNAMRYGSIAKPSTVTVNNHANILGNLKPVSQTTTSECNIVKNTACGKEFLYCRTHDEEADNHFHCRNKN